MTKSKDIILKKSKVHGKGVFAVRDFRKGEVVLQWHPVILTKLDVDALASKDKHYIENVDGEYFLMQSPERYINHSCEPNTQTKDYRDVALKEIKKGEEITSDYGNENQVGFQCRCGNKACRGFIGKE